MRPFRPFRPSQNRQSRTVFRPGQFFSGGVDPKPDCSSAAGSVVLRSERRYRLTFGFCYFNDNLCES